MTARRLWRQILAVALTGAIAFAALSANGPRAALSFLGGVGLALAAFEFGVFNIRLTDRHAPRLTMAVALLSYVTTAIAFGLVLAASSPRVVDAVAVSTGLVVGLVAWLGGLLVTSRARAERP